MPYSRTHASKNMPGTGSSPLLAKENSGVQMTRVGKPMMKDGVRHRARHNDSAGGYGPGAEIRPLPCRQRVLTSFRHGIYVLKSL
jgi:hypothetical protein